MSSAGWHPGRLLISVGIDACETMTNFISQRMSWIEGWCWRNEINCTCTNRVSWKLFRCCNSTLDEWRTVHIWLAWSSAHYNYWWPWKSGHLENSKWTGLWRKWDLDLRPSLMSFVLVKTLSFSWTFCQYELKTVWYVWEI